MLRLNTAFPTWLFKGSPTGGLAGTAFRRARASAYSSSRLLFFFGYHAPSSWSRLIYLLGRQPRRSPGRSRFPSSSLLSTGSSLAQRGRFLKEVKESRRAHGMSPFAPAKERTFAGAKGDRTAALSVHRSRTPHFPAISSKASKNHAVRTRVERRMATFYPPLISSRAASHFVVTYQLFTNFKISVVAARRSPFQSLSSSFRLHPFSAHPTRARETS